MFIKKSETYMVVSQKLKKRKLDVHKANIRKN
jgi:hypothetical protein